MLDIEKYCTFLSSYSLLYFSIIGVDFSNYAAVFRESGMRAPGGAYDCSQLYIEYYRQLSEDFYETGKVLPFVAVTLKHYIWCSSELMKRHSAALLENFRDMKERFVPRLCDYLQKKAAEDFSVLRGRRELKDLQTDAELLGREAEAVLRSNKVQDKLIKYNPEARGVAD